MVTVRIVGVQCEQKVILERAVRVKHDREVQAEKHRTVGIDFLNEKREKKINLFDILPFFFNVSKISFILSMEYSFMIVKYIIKFYYTSLL